MEVIAAKLLTGDDILCRKDKAKKMSLGVVVGEETVYTDILIFDTMRNQQGQAVAVFKPFSAACPNVELTQEQWDKIVLIELPTTKQLESLYLQTTSGIQMA